eukprot:Pgem_evm1s15941
MDLYCINLVLLICMFYDDKTTEKHYSLRKNKEGAEKPRFSDTWGTKLLNFGLL